MTATRIFMNFSFLLLSTSSSSLLLLLKIFKCYSFILSLSLSLSLAACSSNIVKIFSVSFFLWLHSILWFAVDSLIPLYYPTTHRHTNTGVFYIVSQEWMFFFFFVFFIFKISLYVCVCVIHIWWIFSISVYHWCFILIK